MVVSHGAPNVIPACRRRIPLPFCLPTLSKLVCGCSCTTLLKVVVVVAVAALELLKKCLDARISKITISSLSPLLGSYPTRGPELSHVPKPMLSEASHDNSCWYFRRNLSNTHRSCRYPQIPHGSRKPTVRITPHFSLCGHTEKQVSCDSSSRRESPPSPPSFGVPSRATPMLALLRMTTL